MRLRGADGRKGPTGREHPRVPGPSLAQPINSPDEKSKPPNSRTETLMQNAWKQAARFPPLCTCIPIRLLHVVQPCLFDGMEGLQLLRPVITQQTVVHDHTSALLRVG
jgi:hypothetical protein